jgi:ligand-binding SRPBCC domain-containing protein
MEVEQFTGSKKGDQVILKFTLPTRFTWQSDIIEDGHDDNRAWFVDVGTILPWPLKTWRHEHIIEHISPNRSRIVDLMSYSCSNAVLTAMIRPFLFGAFYPRKRIYQKYFSQH